ncbi:ferredoxin-fold anticodon-binding domain-containing protein 1-like protein [Pitangus sulphuratus]|nr:ferredoxin-fold anticodon-binding domain-containing protein 1-like protein [Pitangus sulphuratus]
MGLRRVLLLGEGNFSFAASLCGARATHVVATCYESEEDASRRGGAARSIRRLRESGAEVVFSVDCTKLKDYFSPEKREFDCIYFNFPHCGRKAGVVKNRELLAHFFRRGAESSCVQVLVNNITSTIHSLHQTGIKPNINLQEATSSETTELNDFAAFESQLGKIQYFIFMETDPPGSCEKGSCVGVIRTSRELVSSELVLVFASLNLDLLAMLLCGISDWRMLWTPDTRFLRQFPRGQLRLFKSFSLYPPSYVHDVSFWVPEGEQFDEVAFHTLARGVSGEMVVSVQLRDSFQQAGTGRRSLCYRLTFQSCDRALSCRGAAEMQLRLREEIQRQLGVTLR